MQMNRTEFTLFRSFMSRCTRLCAHEISANAKYTDQWPLEPFKINVGGKSVKFESFRLFAFWRLIYCQFLKHFMHIVYIFCITLEILFRLSVCRPIHRNATDTSMHAPRTAHGLRKYWIVGNSTRTKV